MDLHIKHERINKDWTQEYVATQLGITKQAVQQIEQNQTKPSFEILVKLLELFDKKEAVKEINELFKKT
jgi:DNA-binding helix-turn-helix protein|nr:MAG TPA: Helix-turn-helix XRE-family like protein [Caudoviricetes sp.]